jgi:hypothetical protein
MVAKELLELERLEQRFTRGPDGTIAPSLNESCDAQVAQAAEFVSS